MPPMCPTNCAESGNINFCKEVGLDVIQKTRSENGRPILVVAAFFRHLNCCEMIYQTCPEVLYIADSYASTALHHAAWKGFDDIVEFLISVAVKKEELQDARGIVQDSESGRNQDELGRHKLLMMTNFKMQTALHSAVQRDRLKCGKLLLEADPSNKLLRMVDNENDTAMHIAVKKHNLEIVKLLLERDPGFVYAPNKSEKTPHLIAVQESFAGNATTVTIRNLLIEEQPHECKKQLGANRRTLLHHATLGEDVASIEHILEFCRECVDMVDDHGKNFVHLAAELKHDRVIKHILELSWLNNSVLNQQDKQGNTPLHIATSNENANVGLSLLYDHRVLKFIKNKQGKIALSAINFNYDKRRAGVFGLIDRVDEKYVKERSDFDLVVGALIATVSFTSGIMVPGGFFNDGPNKGNAILHSKLSFQVFVLSNTVALTLSLFAVFCHFCARSLISEESTIYQVKLATRCSLGAIFAMMVAFITGSYAVLAISDWLSISVCVICCCFFGFASPAMCTMIKEERQRRQTRNSRNSGGISV